MKDLIERLEKATGPDRELDGLIYRSLDPVFERCWPHWTPLQRGAMVPQYTSSIDAALTLVPEGFKWKLSYTRHVPCVAEVLDYNPTSAYGRFDGECDSNHAIALCIAALKAREALQRSPADINPSVEKDR